MFIRCPSCNGKGYTPYAHIANGICFSCNGNGKIKHIPNQKRIDYLTNCIESMQKELNNLNNQFKSDMEKLFKMEHDQPNFKNKLEETNKLAKKILKLEEKIKDFKKALSKELNGDDIFND